MYSIRNFVKMHIFI